MDIMNILNDFSNDFDILFNELSEEFYGQLKDNKSIKDALNYAYSKTDFFDILNDKLITSVIDCYRLEYDDEDEDTLQSVLLDIPWIGKDSLSDRIDSDMLNIRQQIEDTLYSNLSILNSLYSYINLEATDEDLYKLKRKLYSYVSPDNDMYKHLDKMKNDINKDNLDSLSSMLDVIILPSLYNIFTGTLRRYTKNIYTRLCNTEGERANFEGILRKTKNNHDVFGYKWKLSPKHYRFPFDICDVNANVNVGYGKGIYPKTRMPIYPAHGHCICSIIPIYKKEIKNKLKNKFNDKSINKYVDSLPEDKKRLLFSAKNMDSYNKAGDISLMYNYSNYVNPEYRK